MKSIYIPSTDILYKMQELAGADKVYNYLLIKVIESLIINKRSNKSILEGTTKKIREDYNISSSIGYIYPEEIKYSETAKFNNILASDLLDKPTTRKIYNLDYLSDFDVSSINLKKIIDILYEELINNPEYRFEYRDNRLLDVIFNGDINYLNDNYLYIFSNLKYYLSKLIHIEPAYGILLPDINFSSIHDRKDSLIKGINSYSDRYHIGKNIGYDYCGKDIINNPDENVKRLIKIINKNKKQ